jgi:nicotinic acid mononucleotide adenylyltransferase
MYNKIEKMLEKEKDNKKELIILVLGGAFNPVHNMHIQ